jgi:hypothetical protein
MNIEDKIKRLEELERLAEKKLDEKLAFLERFITGDDTSMLEESIAPINANKEEMPKRWKPGVNQDAIDTLKAIDRVATPISKKVFITPKGGRVETEEIWVGNPKDQKLWQGS